MRVRVRVSGRVRVRVRVTVRGRVRGYREEAEHIRRIEPELAHLG